MNYQNSNLRESCIYNPCVNGATCINEPSSGSKYYCVCPENYYGKNCETKVSDNICSTGDTDKELCAKWSKAGQCTFGFTYKAVPVPVYCPESCGLCKYDISCADTQPSCVAWANLGLCPKIKAKDPNLCKKSCGLCGYLIKK